MIAEILPSENAAEGIAAFDGIVQDIEIIVFESELLNNRNGFAIGEENFVFRFFTGN